MNRALIVAGFLVASTPAKAGVFVGADLEVHSGSLVLGGAVGNASFDLDTTVGVGGAVGYYGRIFSIALAPRYVPSHHLQIEEGAELSQLDLGVQLGIHNAIGRRTELVGTVTPAYSALYADQMDSALGLAMTFSGGVMYRLSPRFQIGGQLGYQYGAQKTEDGFLVATRLVSVGVFVSSR